ncbi:hypothetical protein A3Q56_05861 [Intoshia linei]|uniref:EGF-like domain-containing protein n=1 Tax=Intoshia linei TaxID=1819745 RepID=A0A177AYG0_9BILA|nr:hypothetical protein A3Q56_05861 [Intoshia linei]
MENQNVTIISSDEEEEYMKHLEKSFIPLSLGKEDNNCNIVKKGYSLRKSIVVSYNEKQAISVNQGSIFSPKFNNRSLKALRSFVDNHKRTHLIRKRKKTTFHCIPIIRKCIQKIPFSCKNIKKNVKQMETRDQIQKPKFQKPEFQSIFIKEKYPKSIHISIDGSNVAYFYSNQRYFDARGILEATRYFYNCGHVNIKSFVPQSRLNGLENENDKMEINKESIILIKELERLGFLILTPSRRVGMTLVKSYDDRFILEYAKRTMGLVLSNDHFREFYAQNFDYRSIIEERILPYTFVNSMILVPDYPFTDNFDNDQFRKNFHFTLPCFGEGTNGKWLSGIAYNENIYEYYVFTPHFIQIYSHHDGVDERLYQLECLNFEEYEKSDLIQYTFTNAVKTIQLYGNIMIKTYTEKNCLMIVLFIERAYFSDDLLTNTLCHLICNKYEYKNKIDYFNITNNNYIISSNPLINNYQIYQTITLNERIYMILKSNLKSKYNDFFYVCANMFVTNSQTIIVHYTTYVDPNKNKNMHITNCLQCTGYTVDTCFWYKKKDFYTVNSIHCSTVKPCLYGGVCIDDVSKGYICRCPTNYFGYNCQRDICDNGPCMNNGTCIGLENEYKCECKKEYTGIRCQEQNKCFNVICLYGGICKTIKTYTKTQGVCICKPNYVGKFCENVDNDMIPHDITALHLVNANNILPIYKNHNNTSSSYKTKYSLYIIISVIFINIMSSFGFCYIIKNGKFTKNDNKKNILCKRNSTISCNSCLIVKNTKLNSNRISSFSTFDFANLKK